MWKLCIILHEPRRPHPAQIWTKLETLADWWLMLGWAGRWELEWWWHSIAMMLLCLCRWLWCDHAQVTVSVSNVSIVSPDWNCILRCPLLTTVSCCVTQQSQNTNLTLVQTVANSRDNWHLVKWSLRLEDDPNAELCLKYSTVADSRWRIISWWCFCCWCNFSRVCWSQVSIFTVSWSCLRSQIPREQTHSKE